MTRCCEHCLTILRLLDRDRTQKSLQHHYTCPACPAAGTLVEYDSGDVRRVGPALTGRRMGTPDHSVDALTPRAKPSREVEV